MRVTFASFLEKNYTKMKMDLFLVNQILPTAIIIVFKEMKSLKKVIYLFFAASAKNR